MIGFGNQIEGLEQPRVSTYRIPTPTYGAMYLAVHSETLQAYLDRIKQIISVDRKLLSVDERMRVSADAFGQTAIASDRGTISTS